MTGHIVTTATDTVEWDTFVRTSSDGTPFHLTAWKKAIERTFGLRSHYLVARRAGHIEGVLPLFEVRGLLGGRALVSVPYAVYGGMCASSDAARRALAKAATAVGRRVGAKYVELRQRRDLGLGLPTKSLYVTFARAISKNDEENLLAIPRKQRRMVRQGGKHALRALVGRNHLDAVYDIYARSLRNLGSPVFPRRLFHAVHDEFDKDCQILTVWHDERVVGGVVSLFFEDQVLPYYGAHLREPYVHGIADFMYWELMCHAARQGYRVFDFGRSREGTGSYDFKRHWGFEPVPLPYQYILLGAGRMPDVSPSNPYVRPIAAAWKRLPLAIANRLGPLLTRYLP
ncbi:MAG: FemAB family XrtA/PEP-CTERM system-associated protein [Candidatus Rokuibacteriota bacterium]